MEFQTRLLNVNLTAVDKSTQKEVEMFLIAIQKNPPIMNLDQYADINRGLITAVTKQFFSVFFADRNFNINFIIFRMFRLWQLIWWYFFNLN